MGASFSHRYFDASNDIEVSRSQAATLLKNNRPVVDDTGSRYEGRAYLDAFLSDAGMKSAGKGLNKQAERRAARVAEGRASRFVGALPHAFKPSRNNKQAERRAERMRDSGRASSNASSSSASGARHPSFSERRAAKNAEMARLGIPSWADYLSGGKDDVQMAEASAAGLAWLKGFGYPIKACADGSGREKIIWRTDSGSKAEKSYAASTLRKKASSPFMAPEVAAELRREANRLSGKKGLNKQAERRAARQSARPKRGGNYCRICKGPHVYKHGRP